MEIKNSRREQIYLEYSGIDEQDYHVHYLDIDDEYFKKLKDEFGFNGAMKTIFEELAKRYS